MPSTPDLLEPARQFDHQALARIYDTFSPGLYRYAMRLLGDPDLAEECVANTFHRFLEALQAGRGPDRALQAYLYRMAHNWMVDRFRRDPDRFVELAEDLPDGQDGPEDSAGRSLRNQHLRMALHRLTPDQQQVVALRFLEGWEYPEIARVLGKPVGAVKSLQNRALASLQKMLRSEDFT